jgi:hypothetical protein
MADSLIRTGYTIHELERREYPLSLKYFHPIRLMVWTEFGFGADSISHALCKNPNGFARSSFYYSFYFLLTLLFSGCDFLVVPVRLAFLFAQAAFMAMLIDLFIAERSRLSPGETRFFAAAV